MYNLRFVTHTLVKKICMDLRSTEGAGFDYRSIIEEEDLLSREIGMREELQDFKRDLCRIVNKACTDVMHANNELFQMEKGYELATESAVLASWCRSTCCGRDGF